MPEFLADEALHRPPTAHGRPLGEVLAVVDRATTKGLNTASPGYFAFIPGGGIVAAAISDRSASWQVIVHPEPELSTVVFSCRADRADPRIGATAELLRRVNAEQRTFLSSTRLGDRHVARICVLNHRTDRTRVAEAIDAIRRHVAALDR